MKEFGERLDLEFTRDSATEIEIKIIVEYHYRGIGLLVFGGGGVVN